MCTDEGISMILSSYAKYAIYWNSCFETIIIKVILGYLLIKSK